MGLRSSGLVKPRGCIPRALWPLRGAMHRVHRQSRGVLPRPARRMDRRTRRAASLCCGVRLDEEPAERAQPLQRRGHGRGEMPRVARGEEADLAPGRARDGEDGRAGKVLGLDGVAGARGQRVVPMGPAARADRAARASWPAAARAARGTGRFRETRPGLLPAARVGRLGPRAAVRASGLGDHALRPRLKRLTVRGASSARRGPLGGRLPGGAATRAHRQGPGRDQGSGQPDERFA